MVLDLLVPTLRPPTLGLDTEYVAKVDASRPAAPRGGPKLAGESGLGLR